MSGSYTVHGRDILGPDRSPQPVANLMPDGKTVLKIYQAPANIVATCQTPEIARHICRLLNAAGQANSANHAAPSSGNTGLR